MSMTMMALATPSKNDERCERASKCSVVPAQRSRLSGPALEGYVSRPTARQWAGSLADGERVVVDGHASHSRFQEVDRDGRVWSVRSLRRLDLLAIAEQLQDGLEVSGKDLRNACRVAAGLAEGQDGQTDLQQTLLTSGLQNAVVRTVAASARAALEHALMTAALRDWPSALSAMSAALGHAGDGLAARGGELWPGRRWRIDRLREVGSTLDDVQTSTDELVALLLFQGLDTREPTAWFSRTRTILHRSLSRLEERHV